ncbi:very short patch repair endonuclease [Burkholderia sp. BCC1644]|uniref:very short patch repair endonuclease n=1 Tax=Burkholderia sp. BCC1644 TaxID=2676293 RepID=UPI0015904B55|nr:very short patch repair endonuclease [Burkholderia sp. BCC1644]
MDKVEKAKRSAIMRAVGSKNTGIELRLRRALHALGYRYRLHVKRLPGSPDLVFPSRRKIVFVHGCFWHGHGCRLGRLPKSNVDFWSQKVVRNQARDASAIHLLEQSGWSVLVVWQCEFRDFDSLVERVVAFLLVGNTI